MMNILLILPRTFINPYEPEHFPVGIAYVSSYLKARAHNVRILNLNFLAGSVRDELEKALREFDADVVATGGLITHYHLIKEVTDASKAIAPGIRTIIGGGLVTCAPLVVMRGIASADFGVVGEGEITSAELCDALKRGAPPDSVAGIVHRSPVDGKPLLTAAREEIKDLDALPWPDYEGFQFEKMLETAPKKYITMSTGRSCMYRCTFCFHTSGKKYRQRSLDGFFQELKWLVGKYGIDNIYVTDEMFANDADRLHEFCRRIKPFNILWAVQLRVDVINVDLLRQLKESGCIILSLGIESAVDRVLKSMRKNTTLKQIEHALACCAEVGIQSNGGFIFGDVEEDEESVAQTIDWWLAHRQYNLGLNLIQVYPGTGLYRYAVEKGIIADELKFIEDGCPYVNVSKLSDSAYKSLALRLEELQAESANFPLELEIVDLDRKQRKVDVSGKCALCGAAVIAKRVPAARISNHVCTGCNSSFTLTPARMFPIQFAANMASLLAENRKVVFVQATRNLNDIFLNYPKIRDTEYLVVDNIVIKHGSDPLLGEIRGYEAIDDSYTAAVICDYFFDIFLKNQIKRNHPGIRTALGMWDIIQPV